jgi:hypothetical protein
LTVELDTSLYSGIGLKYFPENGQHYNELQLSIFNPDSELKLIQLTCPIRDRQHTRGLQLYADRFNKKFFISSGWNLIRNSTGLVIRFRDFNFAGRTQNILFHRGFAEDGPALLNYL